MYMPMAEQCWVSTTGLLQRWQELLVQPVYSCWQHPSPLDTLKSPELIQVGMHMLTWRELICRGFSGTTWVHLCFFLGGGPSSHVPPLCFQPAGIRTLPCLCKVLCTPGRKKSGFGALGERKTKNLKHLHQLKLALKGCKPGPNCTERMTAFEVLSTFLSIKHLSLKGDFQISVHAEIMLSVINYLLITPPPSNLSFPNPHCLSWGKKKKKACVGNNLLLPKNKTRGNPLPLSGRVPNPRTALFSRV